MKKSTHVSMYLTLALLSACGSGGGGAPAEPPTKAIVKLSTSGAASQIGGVDVTIGLPTGVTVKATASPPETDNGVVVASGQAAVSSTLIATSGAGTVRIVLVNSGTNGFGTGEFATITCDLAEGTEPTAGDFTVQAAMVSDINGNSISGATVAAGVVLE